ARRQTDIERCAFADTRALRVYGSAMGINQVADNRQAETKTAVRARRRDVGLAKAFEYEGQKVRIDSLTGIGHHDLDARINPTRSNLNLAAFGSELDRVG